MHSIKASGYAAACRKTINVILIFLVFFSVACKKTTDIKAVPPPPPFTPPGNSNVILILGDDVGYEIPTCNGGQSYSTPNIDFMAQQGMRFTQCHSSPLCSPSRVMLLTGKYNFRNYVDWDTLNITQKTIANMFKDAGYKTACYGKWQLGGGDQSIHTFGFDNYCVWNPIGPDTKGSRYKNPEIYTNGAFVTPDLTLNKYGEDIFTDSVMNFIENNKSSPFFIYYPMVLTHEPFSPTPDDPQFAAWNPDLGTSDKNYFPSMVKYMDKKIGLILNKLKTLGIDKNTIIIYSGDNGTPSGIVSRFNNTNIIGGKGVTTEYGTHVPLVVYWPGYVSGGIINKDINDFTDFLPTLADLVKIPRPVTFGTLDGVSLEPQITNNTGTPRDWIYTYFKPHITDPVKVWVQNTNYKLYMSGEFYNIITDILERHPIPAGSLTPSEKVIKAQFEQVIASLH